jgi:flagellar biosynthesis protein FliQ
MTQKSIHRAKIAYRLGSRAVYGTSSIPFLLMSVVFLLFWALFQIWGEESTTGIDTETLINIAAACYTVLIIAISGFYILEAIMFYSRIDIERTNAKLLLTRLKSYYQELRTFPDIDSTCVYLRIPDTFISKTIKHLSYSYREEIIVSYYLDNAFGMNMESLDHVDTRSTVNFILSYIDTAIENIDNFI